MGLCKYRNLFGKPGKGVHSLRVLNVAVVDLGATILLAVLISWYFKKNFLLNFLFVFLILMIIAIIVHRIFCVNTSLNVAIFGRV